MNNIAIENPVERYKCQVTNISPLSANTFQVELQTTNGKTLCYKAGQYLQLELDVNNDGGIMPLSYSITNDCQADNPQNLQLFIQCNSDFSDKILKRLTQVQKNKTQINVKLPLGQAYLQTNLGLPHLLVAAGSGIAKIKCIAEAILKHNPNASISVYWSNKRKEEFYLLNDFQALANQHPNFRFTPILESDDPQWAGRSGFIYEVIKQDCKNLRDTQAYLCGSPLMVYGTIDQLKSIGLQESNCFSDVFEYAPREQKIAI